MDEFDIGMLTGFDCDDWDLSEWQPEGFSDIVEQDESKLEGGIIIIIIIE